MSQPTSPLTPAAFPTLPPVGGVRLAVATAGLRYTDRPDLMLVALPETTTMAGVFTRSQCRSAPVDWCRRIIGAGRGRAIVANAGNANAFTGAAGRTAARFTADTAAAGLGIVSDEVFLASTGVIGEPMATEPLGAALGRLVADLAGSDAQRWLDAATAIGTTDTFPKGSAAPVAGTSATVVGIAKGSGMIAPDMATMLAFVFTDLAVPAPVLQAALDRSVNTSFNRITVDSDTSTSDTVLLAATGTVPGPVPIVEGGSRPEPGAALQAALDAVTEDLAHQIVRDGEGATKFVTITVTGAASDESAAVIARAIADSPLVKTALAAADANWGRIVMAVGKAGQPADRDRLAIWIGDEQCAQAGAVQSGYREDRATRHLQGSEINIRADVGIAAGSATVWTCDLTHAYIDINAGYRS